MDASKLKRVPLIKNHNHKRDGLKSYGYALAKYHINPTQDGPFFVGNKVHHRSKFGLFKAKLGGKTSVEQHVLMKRKRKHDKHGHEHGHDADEVAGEVDAEDIQHDAEYLCEVSIGTPPQHLMLDLDTGSSDLWLWSTELPRRIIHRYEANHAIFDPSKSATFHDKPGYAWQIQYGDGSSASGSVGTDNVNIGGLVVEGQAIELAETLSAQFQQGTGDGLLGLGFGNINTVKPKKVATPVENMITQSDIPPTCALFTAYLGSWRDANEDDKGQSFYTFGYIDESVLKASGLSGVEDIWYAPVDREDGFWQFSSTVASVNGHEIKLVGNTAIADTGTTLALVSDKVCQAIYGSISGAKYDYSNQGWIFPSGKGEHELPEVKFDVGGKLFTVQKEDLAFANLGNGFVYGGIQSRGDIDLDILGDTFLKAIYAIFDQGNSRFGAVQRVEKFQNLEAE